MSLEVIAEEIRRCIKCSLCRSRRNAVPGEGPSHVNLFFVGEAPGAEEDLQGHPFVGAAGKILDQALNQAGLFRKEVFITNIVKCRPPRNRVPTVFERTTCNPYLKRQIQAAGAKVLCLLGNTAVQTMLEVPSVSKVRGKPLVKEGLVYVCTYHPASILYNPALKTFIYEDIRLLKTLG